MTIETLEPVWSGALEARGEAPGLSSYVGRSTLCGCMDALEALTYREMEKLPNRRELRAKWRKANGQICTRKAVNRSTYAKWPPLNPESTAAILALLKQGVSYSGVVKSLGKRGIVCSRDQARKVAQNNSIERGRLKSDYERWNGGTNHYWRPKAVEVVGEVA